MEKVASKDKLLEQLRARGILTKGTLKQLQELCKANNLPIEIEFNVIKEGWVGKPKGMYQVLYERGFIDPDKEASWYTLQGKKDDFGIMIPGSSLKELMEAQTDFAEEETLLQYHARELGIAVIRTPKCHPELAGEGIEYHWGCAKNEFHRYPISDRRQKRVLMNV